MGKYKYTQIQEYDLTLTDDRLPLLAIIQMYTNTQMGEYKYTQIQEYDLTLTDDGPLILATKQIHKYKWVNTNAHKYRSYIGL